MSNRKGFTLIELLIVVVIIGILAAIAIPKFAATKDKAKLASIKTDLRNLETAQEAYFSDVNTYASDLATLTAASNFTLSAGNAVTAATGDATGYAFTIENSSISKDPKSCSVTVGMGADATVDGVITCTAP
jgi:prepilin-type N-terminal cleavage/methylation domain-containing protein